ncbi:nuclear transport factor 2 family protein [Streptosporangium sp. NPDC023615]|uniref:nuclear transport factor 2 family protein n=1 Tax=Streptosporangium sp. NPDC023615 TaxID=3154794 RepID=UPI00343A5EB8
MTRNDVIDIERQGWRALSSTPEAATEFYERILDRTVVMLLPGGMTLDDRAAIVKAMAGRPWSSHELQEPRVSHPTPDTALVTYGVLARREGDPPYSALMSSLYVRRPDGWRLAFHQQTPR